MKRLILASQSRARKTMLGNAGLQFETMPARLDEKALGQGATPEETATMLAEAKALSIAARHPDALVIGSDQVLEMEGALIDRADNREEALHTLKRLQGRAHRLIAAVCVAEGQKILWGHTESARMTMRAQSDSDLARYADKAGAALTECVGCYALEEAGAWVFDRIEGDYFTVLGMPLLPLLGFLKGKGFGP